MKSLGQVSPSPSIVLYSSAPAPAEAGKHFEEEILGVILPFANIIQGLYIKHEANRSIKTWHMMSAGSKGFLCTDLLPSKGTAFSGVSAALSRHSKAQDRGDRAFSSHAWWQKRLLFSLLTPIPCTSPARQGGVTCKDIEHWEAECGHTAEDVQHPRVRWDPAHRRINLRQPERKVYNSTQI